MWNRYSFEDLKKRIEERLSTIDYEPEKYDLNTISSKNKSIQTIIVKYENVEVVRFDYFISNIIHSDGRRTVHGMFFIKFLNDSEWYNGKDQSVQIDEFFRCNFKDKRSASLESVLDDILPLSDPNKVYQIKTQLINEGLEDFNIKFDTFHNRYLVLGDLAGILELPETKQSENENLSLYKYMSLETYFKMLMNKTFRMNSIVSMNDESESFFLGDELCSMYTGEGIQEKYIRTIENSRTLISSFTDQYDSALMWRLYGDSGRGICINFCVPKNKVTKIHYLSENYTGYAKLKKCVDNLKKQDIRLYFKDIDKFKYYTKSDGFKYEDEYRLSFTCTEEDLSWAKYGNLLSPYRDFSLKGNRCEVIEIEMNNILIGAKLPNFEVNYPLLVDLTNRIFNINQINISEQ